MRFRSREPRALELSPEVADALVRLAREIDRALPIAQRLLAAHRDGAVSPSDRAEALDTARRLSAHGRLCFLVIEEIGREVPEEWSPGGALRVADRLAFALVALSGEEPEPLALLAPERVAQLPAENGAERWLEVVLGAVGEERSG